MSRVATTAGGTVILSPQNGNQDLPQPDSNENEQPKGRRGRKPAVARKLTAGDLLLKSALEWNKECRALRRAMDAISRASPKGLDELDKAIALKRNQLTNAPACPPERQ